MTTAQADLTVVDAITSRRRRYYEEQRKVRRQDHPRASSIGPCAREIALSIKEWALKPPPPAEVQEIFEHGSNCHRIVKQQLLREGFDVVEEELPFEIKEPDVTGNDLIICTGHADGRIAWNGSKPVFEIKYLNQLTWARVETARDFLTMGSFWQKYPLQLLMYMWANSEPLGLFILYSRGHVKVIPVLLDDWIPEMEGALRRCRAAAMSVKFDGALPDFHQDPAVCRTCWARDAGVCAPPMDWTGDAPRVLDDPSMVDDLNRMAELQEQAKEHGTLDRKVKKRMKDSGAGKYAAGPFVVTVESKPRKAYKIPDDVKAKYAEEAETVYVTWEKMQ